MRFFGRSLSTLSQLVADHVVPDACHLCGRVRGAGDRVPLHVLQHAVAAPASVRLLPGVQVTNHPVCRPCAARLPIAAGDSRLGDGTAVVAPFHSGAALLRIIHLVKFSRFTSLLPGLAVAVALRAASAIRALPDPVLVPVPMDRRSVRRRGFNQSERIAAHAGRGLGVPLVPDALEKLRPTRPQSLTGPDRRFENVRGAFTAGPGRVDGRDVVLVDDLVTTGATAAAAARVLAASGAASVTVVSVGRAL